MHIDDFQLRNPVSSQQVDSTSVILQGALDPCPSPYFDAIFVFSAFAKITVEDLVTDWNRFLLLVGQIYPHDMDNVDLYVCCSRTTPDSQETMKRCTTIINCN